MSVRHGKDAYVSGIPCISAWQVSEVANAARYEASCADGGTNVAEGNRNLSGSISGVGHTPPIPTGDDIEDARFIASNVSGDLLSYTADIRILESSISIPVEAGGPITWQSTFGVQGDLTKDTVTAGADATVANNTSGKDGLILMGSGETEIAGVRDITITLRRPESTYVDGGLTYRETGNLQADVSFNVYEDDLDVAAYAVNGIDLMKIMVTPSLFWLFNFIRFTQKSNFQVSRGSLIGFQVNGLWSFASGTTPGYITTPGGTDLIGDSSP